MKPSGGISGISHIFGVADHPYGIGGASLIVEMLFSPVFSSVITIRAWSFPSGHVVPIERKKLFTRKGLAASLTATGPSALIASSNAFAADERSESSASLPWLTSVSAMSSMSLSSPISLRCLPRVFSDLSSPSLPIDATAPSTQSAAAPQFPSLRCWRPSIVRSQALRSPSDICSSSSRDRSSDDSAL